MTLAADMPPGLQNLRRLFWLRAIAMAGQLLAVLATHYGLKIPLPLLPLLAGIGVLGLVNAWTGWCIHRGGRVRPVSDGTLGLQLLADVLVLSWLLFFTGGATNPFVSLYLLPIAIAAAVIRPAYVWLVVGVTSLCYAFLLVWYRPLPHVHALHDFDSRFSLHVLGMWFTFMLAALLMAWFVVRMAASLRERDRLLAHAREENLRHEQIVALGTLAAGAAHELATPLSTIAVLAGELEHAEAGSAAFLGDVRTIRNQVEHCKGILVRLSSAAGQPRAEAGQAQPLDQALARLLERWRLLRPAAVLEVTLAGVQPAPVVVFDAALEQAIHNLLHNAADVSPQAVALQADWHGRGLRIDIGDRGPGITAEARRQAGRTFFTSRPGEGMGVGLVLARATLERLGGTLEFAARDGGGTAVAVTIPLPAIEVSA